MRCAAVVFPLSPLFPPMLCWPHLLAFHWCPNIGQQSVREGMVGWRGWCQWVVGVVRRQLNYQCQRATTAVEAMLLSEQHGKHCKLLAWRWLLGFTSQLVARSSHLAARNSKQIARHCAYATLSAWNLWRHTSLLPVSFGQPPPTLIEFLCAASTPQTSEKSDKSLLSSSDFF